MSLRRIAAFAAFLAVASFATADTKKELEAAYAKFNGYVKTKNLKAMMGFFTSDMTLVDIKGQTSNRAAVESLMATQFRFIQKVTALTTQITKLTVKGNQVLVETAGVLEATISSPGEKATHKLKDASSTTDTWVKVKGNWMISKVVTTKSVVTIDGKKA